MKIKPASVEDSIDYFERRQKQYGLDRIAQYEAAALEALREKQQRESAQNSEVSQEVNEIFESIFDTKS